MDSQPWIAATITTSSRVFDLSKQDPFEITVKLMLHNSRPITFKERSTAIFNSLLLYEGGLTIKNTVTGQKIRRGSLHLCFESSNSDGTPTPQTQRDFITLIPGKEHVVQDSLNPIPAYPCFPTQGLSTQEIDERRERGRTWKWMNVATLEDGQVYELGIDENAAVRTWMQGSVAGILEAKKLGLRPGIISGEIRFIVEEPARFEVMRPDADGSLNWP
ncbi:hypothetical protein K491DRAFT_698418 [Lophiostoma macrostomum CBS 122681]|uniref:Uncharacterized protein n=1 Tax=Lophiostoma macrostomum CBS 122681 TaxID=1314788 RepID=A0A6A6SRS6_9PLEO|nr:hypothetical protein K491DRAFT_698418 [Lophiostoma macrostomum CBS 122681]